MVAIGFIKRYPSLIPVSIYTGSELEGYGKPGYKHDLPHVCPLKLLGRKKQIVGRQR